MAHAFDAAVPAGLPVFEIADAEMASGIFKDIEAAIDAPGSETRPGSASLLPFPSLPPLFDFRLRCDIRCAHIWARRSSNAS